MARDSPSLYLIKMTKSLRNGRIFLDYLRNDRMATAVAPLPPSGATVSMPLTWTQVKADLDPKRLTIRTAPALLAKSTAWKDYCDSLQPLEHAIEQLSKVIRAAWPEVRAGLCSMHSTATSAAPASADRPRSSQRLGSTHQFGCHRTYNVAPRRTAHAGTLATPQSFEFKA